MENKAQRGHTDSKRLREDSSPDVSDFRTRALTHFSLLPHEKGKHREVIPPELYGQLIQTLSSAFQSQFKLHHTISIMSVAMFLFLLSFGSDRTGGTNSVRKFPV